MGTIKLFWRTSTFQETVCAGTLSVDTFAINQTLKVFLGTASLRAPTSTVSLLPSGPEPVSVAKAWQQALQPTIIPPSTPQDGASSSNLELKLMATEPSSSFASRISAISSCRGRRALQASPHKFMLVLAINKPFERPCERVFKAPC